MSLEKAAREYLEFMTSKKGLSWVDYLGESAQLETQLREALENLPNKACSRRVPRRGAKVVKSKKVVRVGRTRG